MKYNTDINIIGSIPDYHLIYMALPLLLSNQSELENILVTNNEFNFRTEKSRKRFLSALNSAFVNKDEAINELGAKLISHFSNDEKSKAIILFWLFSINNKLFYELNKNIFLRYYFQGRAELPKENVIAYLKEVIANNPVLKDKWSEITIDTLASKYLTILKKLLLLEGTKKKHFTFIRITDELLALFIHLYTLMKDRKSNLLEDEFLDFSFVSKENILDRLKKIGLKDWITMNYTGTSLSVQPLFNNKTIIDGIFR